MGDGSLQKIFTMTPSLHCVKTLWGIDEPISPDLFQSIAKEGYEAVEVIRLAWSSPDARAQLIESLKASQLGVVFQIHTAGGYIENNNYIYCGSYSVSRHTDSLKANLDECSAILEELGADSRSRSFVNIHAGVDAWTMEDSMTFLFYCHETFPNYSKAFARITLETHRQRLFHSPFSTRDIFQHMKSNHPEFLSTIHLNADLSHWYCSCERVFDPENEDRDADWWPDLLDKVVLPQCRYIHCRFGWSQGPQMGDPSSPTNSNEVKLQLNVWKKIWKYQLEHDIPSWAEPEYGPAPYQPVHPISGEALGSLAGAVSWTKQAMMDGYAEVLSQVTKGET